MSRNQKKKGRGAKPAEAASGKMSIEYLPVDSIIPYKNNARKNEDAIPVVKASIEAFGFRVPVCVDRDNVLVYGHTRLMAAKELGYTELPVVRADDLTPAQVRAFRLADNIVAEKSGWDFEKLEKELNGITIDMSQFGFSASDIPNIGDFFEDGEKKNKEPKKVKVTCPSCGEVFEVEV